ncbi:MAG: peptidylprolyl isomerase [Phycisphaerae bacterium]
MKQTLKRISHSGLAVALGACFHAACVPVTNGPPATGDPLGVAATTQTPAVLEGASVTLAAVADGGMPPYFFRWDQNAGPVDLDLADPTQATLVVGPLAEPGRYVFRIVVTDSAAAHATDFVSVEVSRAVDTDVPRLIVVGAPAELVATKTAEVDTVDFRWEITQGEGTIDAADTATATLTAAAAETLRVQLTTMVPTADGDVATGAQSFDVVSVASLAPRVVVATTFGDLTLELDGAAAPLHTANFLQYVDEGFYDGLLFHRNVCEADPETGDCFLSVLQGGGYRRVDGALELKPPTQASVPAESDNGLSNAERLTVALALSGLGPDSGTSQFFINLQDNALLDDQGFTVFARVVEGEAALDAILAIETTESTIIPGDPSLPGELSLPIEDVVIQRIMRVADPVP